MHDTGRRGGRSSFRSNAALIPSSRRSGIPTPVFALEKSEPDKKGNPSYCLLAVESGFRARISITSDASRARSNRSIMIFMGRSMCLKKAL